MCILPSVIQCDSELKYVICNKYLQIPPASMQVKFYPLEEDAQFIVRNAMTSLNFLGNIFQIILSSLAQLSRNAENTQHSRKF